MPFGMGPAGWAYTSPYAYLRGNPGYPVWARWGGRRGSYGPGWGCGCGWGRGHGRGWFGLYRYPWC